MTIPSLIIQQSSEEQLTSSHKETHELEKDCAMLQGNIAFICFNLHACKCISVYALLRVWLSAQSVMLSCCLYETVYPTDLELEITGGRLVLCYDSSYNIWTALSIGNKLLLS